MWRVMGGSWGGWRRVPDGCSRDPFDGKAVGESGSLMTFVWQDPSVRDPHREMHRTLVTDEPMRLEIGRDGGGLAAGLTTVKTDAVRIRARDCAVFSGGCAGSGGWVCGGEGYGGGKGSDGLPGGGSACDGGIWGFSRCGY